MNDSNLGNRNKSTKNIFMQKTIYKYPLSITDEQELTLPAGSEILSAQIQHEKPCLWVLIDSDESKKDSVIIETFGTGNPIPEGQRRFIATYQLHGGGLVFHVFQRI